MKEPLFLSARSLKFSEPSLIVQGQCPLNRYGTEDSALTVVTIYFSKDTTKIESIVYST